MTGSSTGGITRAVERWSFGAANEVVGTGGSFVLRASRSPACHAVQMLVSTTVMGQKVVDFGAGRERLSDPND
jgi:hypothetical protein